MASDIHIFLHILLPMMIRIFLHLFLRWNGNITIFCMGMRDIRGVRSMNGDSVQMLESWKWKVLGTEGEGFVPNSSFHISLSTLQHTEVKMLRKKFWSTFMMTASIDSHVYTKSREF